MGEGRSKGTDPRIPSLMIMCAFLLPTVEMSAENSRVRVCETRRINGFPSQIYDYMERINWVFWRERCQEVQINGRAFSLDSNARLI